LKRRPTIEVLNTLRAEGSRLTAIKYIEETIYFSGVKRTAIVTVCVCGNEKIVSLQGFKSGMVKSCGCLVHDHVVPNKKYSYPNDSLRRVYYMMINRCYNRADTAFEYYGGRGVKVCEEWRKNGQSFFDWALLNGYKKGLTLDKDKIGNGMLYSPDTCCWISHEENCNYRSSNRRTEYKGTVMTFTQIIAKIGCSWTLFTNHISKGESADTIELIYAKIKAKRDAKRK
jgi:hypothetical protein